MRAWFPWRSWRSGSGLTMDGLVTAEAAAQRRRTAINQAELLPQLLARTTWRKELENACPISILDSNTALHGLIAGYSGIEHSSSIIRVPSYSNPADGPSRGDLAETIFRNC